MVGFRSHSAFRQAWMHVPSDGSTSTPVEP